MVLGGDLGLHGFLAHTILCVLAKDPPTQAHDAKRGHEEREAHPEPGRNPFADDEKNHVAIIAPTRVRIS